MRKRMPFQVLFGQTSIEQLQLDSKCRDDIPACWEGEKWTIETIKDNVSLLTQEVLDQISQIVVEAGHVLVKKNGAAELDLNGRCDSFVVKTDVHYPTDVSLLLDSVRVIIRYMMRISRFEKFEGWRQGDHLYKNLKKLVREIGRLKKLIRDSKGRKPKDLKRAEQKKKELEKKQRNSLYMPFARWTKSGDAFCRVKQSLRRRKSIPYSNLIRNGSVKARLESLRN